MLWVLYRNFSKNQRYFRHTELIEKNKFWKKNKISNAHNGHNYLFSPFRNTFRTRSPFQGTTYISFFIQKYQSLTNRFYWAYMNLESDLGKIDNLESLKLKIFPFSWKFLKTQSSCIIWMRTCQFYIGFFKIKLFKLSIFSSTQVSAGRPCTLNDLFPLVLVLSQNCLSSFLVVPVPRNRSVATSSHSEEAWVNFPIICKHFAEYRLAKSL